MARDRELAQLVDLDLERIDDAFVAFDLRHQMERPVAKGLGCQGELATHKFSHCGELAAQAPNVGVK